MVDSISSANGARKVATGAVRHRTSPGVSQAATVVIAVEQIAPASGAGAHDPADDRQEDQDDPRDSNTKHGLTLEVSEDGEGGEIVYRFRDAGTGQVVGEWKTGELGKLRDYLRAKNLHILDEKI
ncbi:MAG: hypothetical protein KGR48_14840 [Alphaproteobacteria bacterium]|nr:hypothetical protein [Alphaproteobacteria bacterium]MBU6472846.1 hypothetical protein [Alphaproteobacteria bacterium]MDE2012878.1 hypothetical protein [Alphaproteobacteria bacterium]MDE2073414.1 hypothetical protein [Alphaproteobacteria bacterium]MDE2350709.1 hypothetical protein [Alphaproteobacteria bacterium]